MAKSRAEPAKGQAAKNNAFFNFVSQMISRFASLAAQAAAVDQSDVTALMALAAQMQSFAALVNGSGGGSAVQSRAGTMIGLSQGGRFELARDWPVGPGVMAHAGETVQVTPAGGEPAVVFNNCSFGTNPQDTERAVRNGLAEKRRSRGQV